MQIIKKTKANRTQKIKKVFCNDLINHVFTRKSYAIRWYFALQPTASNSDFTFKKGQIVKNFVTEKL